MKPITGSHIKAEKLLIDRKNPGLLLTFLSSLFTYLQLLKLNFCLKLFRSMLSSHMEPYHGIEEKQSEYRNTFKPDIKGEEVYIVYIFSTV